MLNPFQQLPHYPQPTTQQQDNNNSITMSTTSGGKTHQEMLQLGTNSSSSTLQSGINNAFRKNASNNNNGGGSRCFSPLSPIGYTMNSASSGSNYATNGGNQSPFDIANNMDSIFPTFPNEESRLPKVKNLLGVPTPRFCAYMLRGLHELYTPIGPNICGWNLLDSNWSLNELDQMVMENVKCGSDFNNRFLNFTAHSNLITVLQQNPKYSNFIASACYSGELKIWKFNESFNVLNMEANENPFECMQTIQIPNSFRCQCGFWSADGSKFVICTEGYGGRITVFDFNPKTLNMSIIDQSAGFYQMASFIRPLNGDSAGRYFIFALEQVKQKKECGVSLSLFEIENGTRLNHIDTKPLNSSGPLSTTLECNSNENLLAVAFQDRSVKIYGIDDKMDIKEFCSFTAIGRGTIFMMQFNSRDELSFHNCEKKTIDIYQIQRVNSGEDFFESKLISQHSLNSSAISLYFFKWLGDSLIWTYIDSEFSLVKVKRQESELAIKPGKKVTSIRYHDLTCCGIDFSPDGEFLVTGDFVGQVMLWKTNGNSHIPIMSSFVPGSVRAICCKWHENSWNDSEIDENMNSRILSVFIGSLDKNVHCWNIDLDKMETIDDPYNNIKFSLTSDIVCLRWCNGKCPRLLACGSSNGMLCVMEDNSRESPILKIKLAIIAHKPIFGNKDTRFGSISKFSEIWSVCFSPCNQYVVTCSEDQTTRIFDLYGTQLHSLTGHTTAVTSVEWKYIKGIGELIVTCADDRTVMVWRLNTQYADKDKHYHHYHQLYELEKQQGQKALEEQEDDFDKQERHSMDRWGLYHVFRTDDQYGLDWHTLTYLQIEPRGTRLSVSTQNGYVFVWDLRFRKLVSFGKGHQGSIEGLKWITHMNENGISNLLATCSSDCTINIFEMHY